MLSKLDSVQTKLEAKFLEFDEYRVKLRIQVKEKESSVKSNVEEWKISRKIKFLDHCADKLQ